METGKSKIISIEHIGPVRSFTFEVAPGMNEIRGQNGAGKSNILAAISRAVGADVSVDVTDGEARGTLRLDDQVLLTLTRSRAKADASVEVSLASVSPLAVVIDPGIKDPKAAEQARIKALLQLFDLKVTPEIISELVAGDEGALDVIDERIGTASLLELDPVTVASKLTGPQGVLNKRKRELEQAADEAHGRWMVVVPKSKPEALVDVSIQEAQARYDDAVGDYRQAQGEASQRAEREAEREEIRRTLGERPDTEATEMQAHEARLRYEVALSTVHRLRQELAVAETLLGTETGNLTRAANIHHEAEELAEMWDRRKAILDSEITGPTETDVEQAAARVESARGELEAARATAMYQENLAASESAREQRERLRKLASRYEQLAKGVPARLGGLLKSAGIPGLTVEDGVLHVIHEGGELEPFARLSAGQRTRIAMPLFIARNPNKLVAFNEEFWHSLEQESKEEVARILEGAGVIGLTEVPTSRGDGLSVEHFGSEAVGS